MVVFNGPGQRCRKFVALGLHFSFEVGPQIGVPKLELEIGGPCRGRLSLTMTAPVRCRPRRAEGTALHPAPPKASGRSSRINRETRRSFGSASRGAIRLHHQLRHQYVGNSRGRIPHTLCARLGTTCEKTGSGAANQRGSGFLRHASQPISARPDTRTTSVDGSGTGLIDRVKIEP
jgi:hypothetical protein